MYFSSFLAYKPELMPLAGLSDDDLAIALRAMSADVAPLEEFVVLIEDDKFAKYLKTEKKLGKLKNAGLAELSKAELEEAIRSKVHSNYLYNLDWRDEADYQGSFFNIMLVFAREDGSPERMTV